MNAKQKILWTKIQAFQLDDPAVGFKYSGRLARENGWKMDYVQRVIEEYKRYIFLSCVAEHAVTPSDQVDQAWHLHLLYTKSYWVDLCRDVLGREIHHNPTRGGGKERKKFGKQYAEFKVLYEETFDEEPPEDIWPSTEKRFKDIVFRRVNVGRKWIIPKPPRIVGSLLLGALGGLTVMTFVQAEDSDIFGWIVAAIITLFSYIFRKRVYTCEDHDYETEKKGNCIICGKAMVEKQGESGCGGCGGCG